MSTWRRGCIFAQFCGQTILTRKLSPFGQATAWPINHHTRLVKRVGYSFWELCCSSSFPLLPGYALVPATWGPLFWQTLCLYKTVLVIVAKSSQAPCWASKVVGHNRVPCELGNNFIFHLWFFSQSQQIAIMIDLWKIFQSRLVNYNATNYNINIPL